jgi:hypothetical protein
MIGSLIDMSIVQGGPGFPVLLPVLYGYISTGQYNYEFLTNSTVPDFHVQSLLAEVRFVCGSSVMLSAVKCKWLYDGLIKYLFVFV